MIVILTVRPDLLQARVVRALQLAEDLWGRRGIVHRRAGHDDGRQQAQGIHQDMAFSARDLLAAIITVFATEFGRLDGLTIDAGGTGRVLLPRGLPHSGPQGIEGGLPRAIDPPLTEIRSRPWTTWGNHGAASATGSRCG